jgi:hypothetical protein
MTNISDNQPAIQMAARETEGESVDVGVGVGILRRLAQARDGGLPRAGTLVVGAELSLQRNGSPLSGEHGAFEVAREVRRELAAHQIDAVAPGRGQGRGRQDVVG